MSNELEVSRSWVSAVEPIKEVCSLTWGTNILPDRYKGANGKGDLLATMLYGDALGFSPIVAANQIYVINGTVTISAMGQRALALAHGHEIVIDERGPKRAKVRGRRAGSDEWSSVTYTIEEAAQAKLTGKQVWQQHPAEMLLARATSILCRTVFADVLQGIAYSTEEVQAENEPDLPPTVPIKLDRPAKPLAVVENVTDAEIVEDQA